MNGLSAKLIPEQDCNIETYILQVGEGEKLVRAMFALARELQPSIVFMGTNYIVVHLSLNF